MDRELRRMLPRSIALRVRDHLYHPGISAEIAALYDSFDQVVSVALSGGTQQARIKGFHEVAAHALRGGTKSLVRSLYTDEEWKLLVAKAKEVNAEAALPTPIAGVPAIEGYRRVYIRQARDAGLRGANLRAHVVELLDQERVGALAEQWISGADFGTRVNTLLARILKLLEAIRNALKGLGFQTYDDVFQRVVGGELAERGDRRDRKATAEAKRAAEEIDASWPEIKARALDAARRRWPQAEETQQTRARVAEELPDVDGMDTFELRHLAKDMGLPDDLWRGRRAAEIGDAIKRR